MTDIKLKLKQLGVSAIRMFLGTKMKEKCVYYNHIKEWPNLEDPKTWGEKLLWLNHHWQPEIKSLCADKYRVREFLKQQGLENILVDLLGVWDKAEDIDFDKLPDKFVLKCNHDSGSVKIVTDKRKMDHDEFEKVFFKKSKKVSGLTYFFRLIFFPLPYVRYQIDRV